MSSSSVVRGAPVPAGARRGADARAVNHVARATALPAVDDRPQAGDRHRDHRGHLTERLRHAAAKQAVVGSEHGHDRRRRRQSGCGERRAGAAQRARHLCEQRRPEEVQRVAPFEPHEQPVNERHERHPPPLRGVLHGGFEVVREVRQPGVDVDVEGVVARRRRRRCEPRGRAVLARDRRRLPARAAAGAAEPVFGQHVAFARRRRSGPDFASTPR